jgi:hypothetical protein
MDSLVEAQNTLEGMSDAERVTLVKVRRSRAARLLFMPVVNEVSGLKAYRGQKRKDRFGVKWRCKTPLTKEAAWP